MIAIVKKKIHVEDIVQSVQIPEAGGIDIFIGTTRNHTNAKRVISLEYEAYEPMALKMMNEIAEEARSQWDIHRIAMVHRVGSVSIGEASVAIAVSASHRKEAFEACRFAIDRLKAVVPIWKKEFFEDGQVWVENEESFKGSS